NHVGLYWCAAAILAALAGKKDTETQGLEGLAIARLHPFSPGLPGRGHPEDRPAGLMHGATLLEGMEKPDLTCETFALVLKATRLSVKPLSNSKH
ncbi:hypothetical protein KUDE01_002801, partial [Dissostichus eleginoides]